MFPIILALFSSIRQGFRTRAALQAEEGVTGWGAKGKLDIDRIRSLALEK
jgi:hypothetical protein